MYAQLCKQICKQLCENYIGARRNEYGAANDTDAGDNDLSQLTYKDKCIFRRLLLGCCEAEFENRAKITQAFEKYDPQTMSPEIEERRQIAKHKMLGNIKFIGELAKLEILAESILHTCIQTLLRDQRRKNRDPNLAAERCEDLECLSQILRTCGRVLDHDKTKEWMNKYFEQISKFAHNQDLPPRIRFMLRDVIELRSNNWVPRQVTISDGPVPINQIRPVDEDVQVAAFMRDRRERNNHNEPRDFLSDRGGQNFIGSGNDSPLFRHQLKYRNGGLNDVYMSLSMPMSTPFVTSDKYSPFGNNYNNRNYGNDGSNYNGGQNNNRNQRGNYNNYNNQRNNYNKNNNQNYSSYNNNNANNNNTNKEVAPRFKKNLVMIQSPGEVELRPAPNSMLFNNKQVMHAKQKTPASVMTQRMIDTQTLNQTSSLQNNRANKYFTSATIASNDHAENVGENNPPSNVGNSQVVTNGAVKSSMHKDAPLVLKQTTAEKPKSKKDKGPRKDEILKQIEGILEKYLQNGENALSEAVRELIDLNIPPKFSSDAVLTLMNGVLDKTDNDKKMVGELLNELRKTEESSTVVYSNVLKQLLKTLAPKLSNPVVMCQVAHLIGQCICQGLFTLTLIGTITETELKYYPLFFVILEELQKIVGEAKLTQMFNEKKIMLIKQLPEEEREKERLSAVLEERNLLHLYPMIKIEAELSKQLSTDPNPNKFYKWIKDNVDVTYHTDPAFINALITVLVKYITSETTLARGADPVDKSLHEKEKTMLGKYQPILRAFLKNVDLQVIAIYVLQTIFFQHGLPKGMLLRWFNMLYDNFEVCEEEAFLTWKDDVNDMYPGKGDALFQVHQWLEWLQSTSDDEGDDDDDD